MPRLDGRKPGEMRPFKLAPSFQTQTPGAVLVQIGNTLVHCAASIEDKTPAFLDPLKEGWLTCEYSMLPTATGSRSPREVSKGKTSGRTTEIQRLIGRSLRQVLDLSKIPGKTIWVDCDVLQADGGTRTASISGASVAVKNALDVLFKNGGLRENPFKYHIAAISAGMVQKEPLLDLDYLEDSQADSDMNLVMTAKNQLIELQISAERQPVEEKELETLVQLGKSAIRNILDQQKQFSDLIKQNN